MVEVGGFTGTCWIKYYFKTLYEKPRFILIDVLSCFEANLNGEYFEDPTANDYYRGIIWELWHGDYSLRSAKMMIRPKSIVRANLYTRDP